MSCPGTQLKPPIDPLPDWSYGEIVEYIESHKETDSHAVLGNTTHEMTLVVIKPEALIRRQASIEIIDLLQRIPDALIVEFLPMRVSREFAERHYAEHRNALFFPKLVTQLSCPLGVIMIVMYGRDIVQRVRDLCGSSMVTAVNCHAAPNTIRSMYGISMGLNAIHASATVAAARKEIEMWKKRPFDVATAHGNIEHYKITGGRELRSAELKRVAWEFNNCAEQMIKIMTSESYYPEVVIREFMRESCSMAFK